MSPLRINPQVFPQDRRIVSTKPCLPSSSVCELLKRNRNTLVCMTSALCDLKLMFSHLSRKIHLSSDHRMHLVFVTILSLALVRTVSARHDAAIHSLLFNQVPLQDPEIGNTGSNGLPSSTRKHWMRAASSANLAISACPFAPYGTAVVNHTLSLSNSSHLGELICTGVNDNHHTGNPILHGEMAAFVNCSQILTDPKGVYRLSATEARETWKGLSLYTTAEVRLSVS